MITKPQPQLAQLECLFSGPLVKGSMVNSVNDLISLTRNYLHKRVWVITEKTNYYLDNGNGNSLLNWKKVSGSIVLKAYNSAEAYKIGDCVFNSRKLYSAIQDIPVGYSPADYESYWLCISGETETYRYIFENVSSVLIYTEIRNPRFEIILGDFEYDVTDPTLHIINAVTGLVELKNEEIVEAYIVQRQDLANNNGVPYEIIFYENETKSVQVSGCINIK